MLSFLHTADVHLDAPLHSLAGSYESRQDDFRRTMRRIRDLVLDRQADVWLIAGDLLELHGGRRSTAIFLRDLFASVAPTPVCIAPGNHDPWRADSFYQSLDWPANVYWFTPEWGAYEFPEKSCVIYGWGFPQPHVYESPLADFPGRLAGYCHHLMVLHASVVHSGGEEHHPYAPVTVEELARTGMDYVALGHIHKPMQFLHPVHRQVFAAYPGSPEGLTLKESGPRHVLYGELDGEGRLRLEDIPVQTRMILKWEIMLQGEETMEQLIERMERELADVEDGQIAAVTLTGERPAHFQPVTDVLEQRFSRFFSMRISDRSRPDVDVEKVIAEGGVWGSWLSLLLAEEAAAADEQRREVARLAVREALDRIGGDHPMRIDELSIKGFGKWRDARFRFAPGLNLFAAPNEAGKTTLLQALFASLYGMKKDYVRSARYLPEYERYLPWHDGSYETVVRYELDGKRYQLHRRLAKEREQAQLYLDPDWTEVTHLYQEDRRKERNFLELHLGLTRSLFTDLTWIRRTPLEAAEYLLPSLSGGGETDPAVNRMLSEMDRELAQIGKKERAENTLLGKAGARVAEKERELAEAEKSWAAVQALTRQLAVWEERRQELQHGMERIHQRLARLQAAEQNWQTRWQQSFAQHPWERAEQWIETAGTEEERELHQETWRKWTALGAAYAEEKSRLLSIREDASRQERIEETYRRASELRKTREACIAEAQKLAERALHSGRQRRKPDGRHVSPALWWTGSIFGLLLAGGLYAAGEPVLSLIALSVCLAAACAGAMAKRRKQAGEGHSHQQRAWLEWQEKAAGCEAEIDGLLRQWGMADWDSFLVLREEEKHRAQGKEAGIAALEGRHQEEEAQLAGQWGEAFRRLLEEEKNGLDREREQLEQEQRQLGEQLQLIREQMARAAGEIGGQDEVSLAKARSEYEEAVEDLRRLQMKREALALARETLQQVLHEWNREFSPALNRIASALMARITGGKYADVRLDLQSQFDVKIWEASQRRIVEQERCSTGTQDQLYLVQRLALLRHVSGQSEPLPIFLDDHFVHYDAGRLERTLELLAELSREHQVFLFSCTERERELLQPWIEGDGRHRLHLLPSS